MLRSDLGVSLTVGPSTVITFLRIELDTFKFEARLPQDKLLKAKESAKFWISIRYTTERKLSLIGYLHHCSKVIVPARPFVRHLIDLSTTVKDLGCQVHLSKLSVT